MRLYILLSFILLAACQKNNQKEEDGHNMSVKGYPFLEPSDLNIKKYRFKSTPKSNEVAVFRSKHKSEIDKFDHMIYDQIMWTNGEEAHVDVVITPLSFYLDYPEPDKSDPETFFRDRWKLWAGGYSYDIKDFTFLESNWSFSGDSAKGSIIYTKKNRTKTHDLVFNFEMFILSLDEAKKRYPKLDIKRDEGTTSWEAAFLIEPKQTEQVVAPDGE